MIEIPSKRGWTIRLHEPREEPTAEAKRHFYNTVVNCLLEIEKNTAPKVNKKPKK